MSFSFLSGIPDAEARYHILNVLLSKAPHSVAEDDLRSIAAKAHGYVGADLSAVVREAGTLAIKRWLASQPPPTSSDSPPSASPSSVPQLTYADLEAALPTVRPSALRSLFLDTVPVHYSDIGGQAQTIQKLRECVEWPLLHPEAFARLGVRAPRGVLLYGPPGCSKTLLVRACATESGVNFLAVKGPEVFDHHHRFCEWAEGQSLIRVPPASEQVRRRVGARRARDLQQSPRSRAVDHLLRASTRFC